MYFILIAPWRRVWVPLYELYMTVGIQGSLVIAPWRWVLVPPCTPLNHPHMNYRWVVVSGDSYLHNLSASALRYQTQQRINAEFKDKLIANMALLTYRAAGQMGLSSTYTYTWWFKSRQYSFYFKFVSLQSVSVLLQTEAVFGFVCSLWAKNCVKVILGLYQKNEGVLGAGGGGGDGREAGTCSVVER